MNKLILAAFALSAITITSCEKCSECHYDGPDGEVELGEFCGDDLETQEEAGYYDESADTTYEVHCSEH